MKKNLIKKKIEKKKKIRKISFEKFIPKANIASTTLQDLIKK